MTEYDFSPEAFDNLPIAARFLSPTVARREGRYPAPRQAPAGDHTPINSETGLPLPSTSRVPYNPRRRSRSRERGLGPPPASFSRGISTRVLPASFPKRFGTPPPPTSRPGSRPGADSYEHPRPRDYYPPYSSPSEPDSPYTGEQRSHTQRKATQPESQPSQRLTENNRPTMNREPSYGSKYPRAKDHSPLANGDHRYHSDSFGNPSVNYDKYKSHQSSGTSIPQRNPFYDDDTNGDDTSEYDTSDSDRVLINYGPKNRSGRGYDGGVQFNERENGESSFPDNSETERGRRKEEERKRAEETQQKDRELAERMERVREQARRIEEEEKRTKEARQWEKERQEREREEEENRRRREEIEKKKREQEQRRPKDEIPDKELEAKSKERETRMKEEEWRRRERKAKEEARKKEEEFKRKEEEFNNKVEEWKRKASETRREEQEEARRTEEEWKKKDRALQEREEETERKELELERKEEEVRRREEELREKIYHFEEKKRKMEEELNEETKRIEWERMAARQREEEFQKRDEELSRFEMEALARFNQQQAELLKREEEIQLQEKALRAEETRREEATRKEEEGRSNEPGERNLQLSAQDAKPTNETTCEDGERSKAGEIWRGEQPNQRQGVEYQKALQQADEFQQINTPGFSGTKGSSSYHPSSGTPSRWAFPRSHNPDPCRFSLFSVQTSVVSYGTTLEPRDTMADWQRRQEELYQKQQEQFRQEQERLDPLNQSRGVKGIPNQNAT